MVHVKCNNYKTLIHQLSIRFLGQEDLELLGGKFTLHFEKHLTNLDFVGFHFCSVCLFVQKAAIITFLYQLNDMDWQWSCTGYSLSETFIFQSMNPNYNKRLTIELQIQ